MMRPLHSPPTATPVTAGPLELDRELGSLLLPLGHTLADVPARPVIIEGREFDPKPELHVTFVGKRTGRVIVEAEQRTGWTMREV